MIVKIILYILLGFLALFILAMFITIASDNGQEEMKKAFQEGYERGASVSGEEEKKTLPVEVTPAVVDQEVTSDELQVTDEELSSIFYDSYMEGCMDEDVSVMYCDCTYEYLIDKYSEDEVSQMGLDFIITNDIPPAMMDAAESCLSYL